MLRRKKSTSIYTTLLKEAFTLTWQRKSLWIFGLFAGLISTGGVVEVALLGIRRITCTSSLLAHLMNPTFVGYTHVSSFILTLEKIGPSRLMIALTLCTLFGILFLCAGIISQAALIRAVKLTQKDIRHIQHSVHKHFWDIFAIDACTKILTILLTALTALPTLYFLLVGNSFTSTLLFVHLILFIPSVIILHILSMLAIVDVVEADHHALHAIHQSLRLFKKHWLTTIEFGFLLFAVVCVAGLLMLSLLVLLSIPYTFLITLILISGSSVLFLVVNFILLVCFFLLVAGIGGAIVSFQYHAWCVFYQRATHKIHGKKSFAKILRLFGK